MHRTGTDPPTGLPTTPMVGVAVAQLTAGRHGLHDDDGACVIALELDGFAGVNRSFGHEAGDALIAAVARRRRGPAAVARPGARGDRTGRVHPSSRTRV